MEKSRVYEYDEQKDLGILVCSNLMPRKHIEAVCSKVNRKTGMTKRCFMNKSREQMSFEGTGTLRCQCYARTC